MADTLSDPEMFDRAQPKWKSSQPGEDYMIKAEGLTPATIPGQRIVGSMRDPDVPGYTVQVAVPHLPYERWIDDAGNVCSCPVKTNRVKKKNGSSVDDGNYHTQVTERAYLRAGWVRFDDGKGYIPTKAHPAWTPEARQALIDERLTLQRQRTNAQEVKHLDQRKREADQFRKDLLETVRSVKEEGEADRQRRASKRAELDK